MKKNLSPKNKKKVNDSYSKPKNNLPQEAEIDFLVGDIPGLDFEAPIPSGSNVAVKACPICGEPANTGDGIVCQKCGNRLIQEPVCVP